MSAALADPFDHYRNVFTSRSAEELGHIARIKRCIETLTGTVAFREALRKHPDQAQRIAEEYGQKVDMDHLEPLWKRQDRPTLLEDDMDGRELALLWRDWIADHLRFRDLLRDYGSRTDNAAFAAWRNRQIARCSSELGASKDALVHAAVSYELSTGCSVGCWFCGLNSASFAGFFPRTPENATLWRETLAVMRDFLGPAVQTGFCYWATEPTDNPDYLDLVDDYAQVLGVLPQTTMSRPLKDIAWTKRLLAMHKAQRGAPSRFSVLSRTELVRIHQAFSPEELLGIELVQQHRDAMVCKAKAGRLVQEDNIPQPAVSAEAMPAGHQTIACVSGFLLNMRERSIALVSPRTATADLPAGYLIHAQGSFDSAADVIPWLAAAVREHMPTHLRPETELRFRPDLRMETTPEGFTLATDFASVRVNGPGQTALGQHIASGTMTYAQIFSALIGQTDFLTLTGTLQSLFDQGLLDDRAQQAPGRQA